MKAAVLGATGLIGGYILELLLEDPDFEEVHSISRRTSGKTHPRLSEHVIGFEDDRAFSSALRNCEVIFSAIGTTQKQVKGDKVLYRKIDVEIPGRAARLGREAGCKKIFFVSSIGADAKSGNFYLKLKGELETTVFNSGMESAIAFQPSMLLGNRNENRPAERLFQGISKAVSFLLPDKYKPIEAQTVARAMVLAAKNTNPGNHVYRYNEMMELQGNYKS